MMNKKTINDVSLNNKRVIMRVDFNVPMDNGVITDDTRIQAALPSIKAVIEGGGSLVLMSHLGRPKGKGYEAAFSLMPIASYLAKTLGTPISFASDCLKAKSMADALQSGEILMLENTRFHKEEQGKIKKSDDMSDEDIAAKKAEMKDKQKSMAKKRPSNLFGQL